MGKEQYSPSQVPSKQMSYHKMLHNQSMKCIPILPNCKVRNAGIEFDHLTVMQIHIFKTHNWNTEEGLNEIKRSDNTQWPICLTRCPTTSFNAMPFQGNLV